MIRKFAIKALVVFLSSIFSFVSFPGILTANNNIKELTLKEAIQIATTNNYVIKETIEKQRAALEAEKSATADLLPKLSASYSYMRLKHSPYAVFSYSELPIGSQKVNVGDKDNYGWDVTLSLIHI